MLPSVPIHRRAAASRAAAPRTTVSGVSLAVGALVLTLAVAASAGPAEAGACAGARKACAAAATHRAQACRLDCRGLHERAREAACEAGCRADARAARAACGAVPDACAAACATPADAGAAPCTSAVDACRRAARGAFFGCRRGCRSGADAAAARTCRRTCAEARAAAEESCGFTAATAVAGAPVLPDLPLGEAADLSLLEPAERAAVEAADERAVDLRTRTLQLSVAPGTAVELTQVRHAFPLGFTLDLRRFAGRPAADLDFYLGIARDHTSLAVLENSAKWNNVEPAEGVRVYDAPDADVAAARQHGFAVKGHPLNWGIAPQLSASGMPGWLLDRFPGPDLAPADRDALREVLRRHVVDLVARYRDEISIWDVTNETMQPFGSWFVDRLGPDIVADLFRWAHEADPDATLVFNEWLVEVFTGFATPTAAEVRDRVLELLAAGVPVHAVGQQAHFVPALAFAGVPVDLSQRTRIDDYVAVLDTLAETGLPIHVTEMNVIAPEEPEQRAAQAEALMRVWWGHPAVEQVVFWGLWNAVAGRDEFDVGLWSDDRTLSRHGAAVLSLLNDRWRTRASAVAGADGTIELRATHGEYVAAWTVDGAPVHARFRVEPGPGPLKVALLAGPDLASGAP